MKGCPICGRLDCECEDILTPEEYKRIVEANNADLLHLYNAVCCEKAYAENVQVCKQCQEESILLMSIEIDEDQN